MKQLFSKLLAVVLVLSIGLVGCGGGGGIITGDYSQDTMNLVNSLRTAIELPEGSPEKMAAQAEARGVINEYASRYARNPNTAKLPSFTTMRTALNGLAGHYNYYPNRPIPEKLKNRLEQEFRQVEASLRRGA